MGHNHSHNHDHHHSDAGIRTAFFLNITFTVIEIIGGILTNSVAILSDALHDLGDSVALGFSWAMEKISRKGPSDRLTFGYRRYSVLGALFSSVVLITGSIFILTEAAKRILQPESVVPEGMLPLAILGIGVNLAAALKLRHDGDHINQRVIMLHLLEDVLGWVAVLIVSLVLLFADIPVLDPILSMVTTVFVLSRIIPRLTETLRVFMQYSPGNLELETIRGRIRTVRGVAAVHDTHLWSIDGREHIFSAHVVLTENLTLLDMEKIKKVIKNDLEEMGISHGTIEFEPVDSLCRGCKE